MPAWLHLMAQSLWPLLYAGFVFTVPLTLASFAIGVTIAFFAALLRLFGPPAAARAIRFYIWLFRGSPLLMQLFVIFYGLPNVGIVLVKDTPLAAVLTVPEIFQAAQRIAAVTYEPLILYTEAALIYLLFSSVLSAAQVRLEERFGRHARFEVARA